MTASFPEQQPASRYPRPAPPTGLGRLGRWATIAGATALAMVGAAGLCLAIYAGWLFHDLPSASDLVDYRPPTSSRVYAADGTLIGEFGRERRIFVPYDQIPPQLVHAFLSAEDHNFFEHGGIDMQGLGRAMTRDAFSAVTGKRLQGGSTITQQVAKNVLLTNEHTLGRKLKEAILAHRLEQTLSKERILELYLNEIWLGNHSFGVGMAAYNYFGKSLNQLSLPEMAYLASLPKGPSNYDPVRHKANAIGRRNWVLGQMAENGWASRAAAADAQQQDLVTQTAPARAHYRDADYFMEEVGVRARAKLGQRVDEAGLYMRTTMDSRLQTAARIALMDGLEQYDRRHGWRGAMGRVEIKPGWEDAARAQSPASERRAWRTAVVDRASGGAHVLLADGGAGELDGADVAWARAGKGLSVGDLVFVEPNAGGGYALRQTPAVNGALVAIEPRSGQVLALVGGYSFSLSKYDRATQAHRQPGSAFKPFVYAAALENGFTPASIVLDAPVYLPGANGSTWSPENDNHRSAGPQPFRNGLVYSRNQMTVRIAQKVGMRKILDAAARDGVIAKPSDWPAVLPIALGAGEVTPLALTGAYAAFPNGGRRVDPHLVELAEDRTGHPVWKADTRDCPGCGQPYSGEESPRIPPRGEQVMDPVTAYQMATMLQGVVAQGTATSVGAAFPDKHIAGKTGTTNDYRSAWFVGFTPDIVVGAFIGFDDNRSLGEGEVGGKAATPIFIDFMREYYKTAPAPDFKAPKTAKFAGVGAHREAFRPGTEPRPAPRPLAPSGPAFLEGRPTGPIPYDQLGPRAATPSAGAAPPNPSKSPPKTAPADLNGLY